MRIASLDIETLGSAKAIIEIGVLFIEDDVEVGRIDTLVDPGIPVPHMGNGVSGITASMLAGQPTIDQVLPGVLDSLRGWTILGHNISYDIGCINDEAVRWGLTPLSNSVIDTMQMSKSRWSDRGQHTLLDLLRATGIADREVHRALPDAIQTWQCYRHLRDHHEFLEWTDELADQSRKTRTDKNQAFLKSRYLKGVDTTKHNVKPLGEELPPGKSVTVTGTKAHADYLAAYGDFTYLWVEIDAGVIPDGAHAGEPTYFVTLDGRRIGYLSYQTAAKYHAALPEQAVCSSHTKLDKSTGTMKFRLELPNL